MTLENVFRYKTNDTKQISLRSFSKQQVTDKDRGISISVFVLR
jgi:hypothetical protein